MECSNASQEANVLPLLQNVSMITFVVINNKCQDLGQSLT